MTNEKTSHLVLSTGCRSLQFVPGFTSPAFSNAFGHNNNSKASSVPRTPSNGPFKGLVICVTGLSKEARIQVQEATERMGGQYSPDLHPHCTHLIVQSFVGRKFEHALKHGIKRGLFVVTLAWFVNSAKLNERLDESSYAVSKAFLRNSGLSPENRLLENSGEQACLPSRIEETKSFDSISLKSQVLSPSVEHRPSLLLRGFNFYLDPYLSDDLRTKVVAAASKEGATFADDWYMGCNVTHVVCERNSFLSYAGSICNLVTPLWLLKSLKEHALQRLVQLSADLARHLAFVVDPSKSKSKNEESGPCQVLSHPEREELVTIAKEGVRKRRGQRKQPCRTLPRPISPASLLDSLCWSVTDSPSAAKLYADRSPDPSFENEYFDADDNGNTSASESESFTRLMKENERHEVVYSGVYLTVLFPVDRFAEMGPTSRCFFSGKGFTRQQILENVYAFYQEDLSDEEIKVAINTDSKHADKLRALYAAKDSRFCCMKRCEFLGGRRNFEGLKRLSRENTGQVYELWLGS